MSYDLKEHSRLVNHIDEIKYLNDTEVFVNFLDENMNEFTGILTYNDNLEDE